MWEAPFSLGKCPYTKGVEQLSLGATDETMVAFVTWGAPFSVGECPHKGFLTSGGHGLEATGCLWYTVAWYWWVSVALRLAVAAVVRCGWLLWQLSEGG
mgnify:CR=1 FL=1